MTRLRITPDGVVRGLWTDEIEWQDIGRSTVTRASHVEFDERRQMWLVRDGRPGSVVGRVLQRLTGRPFGRVLYWAKSRAEALAWERAYYGPGGSGWPPPGG